MCRRRKRAPSPRRYDEKAIDIHNQHSIIEQEKVNTNQTDDRTDERDSPPNNDEENGTYSTHPRSRRQGPGVNWRPGRLDAPEPRRAPGEAKAQKQQKKAEKERKKAEQESERMEEIKHMAEVERVAREMEERKKVARAKRSEVQTAQSKGKEKRMSDA